MSKRVRTVVDYFDDLTGNKVDESDIRTIQFTWRGIGYEIDLSPDNAEAMDALMTRFTEAGRRLDGRNGHKAVRRSSGPRALGPSKTAAEDQGTAERREVRQWARAQGMNQSMVGKIKSEVYEAWNEAHPDRPMYPPEE